MIELILPRGVITAIDTGPGHGDDSAIAGMWPSEAATVATASQKRRSEFAAVRALARRALSSMDREPAAIPRGGKGMPVWPTGVVGTMTHCDGYRAAALAEASDFRSVGVDVEPHAPLPRGVLDTVSLPEERDWVRAAAMGEPGVHWDLLLFTAKEATYKVWYPLTRRWLGFADARVTFRVDNVSGSGGEGGWTSEILVDPATVDSGPALTTVNGRWIIRSGHAASAAAPPVEGDT